MEDLEHLKYPIGRFTTADHYTPAELASMLVAFRDFPATLDTVCQQLEKVDRWDIPYRRGGWTARQVVHHLADSHLNAYQRFKHTLTEDNPILRGYEEGEWAKLADYRLGYFVSQNLLRSIHERIYVTLKGLPDDQWQRACTHPSQPQADKLSKLLAIYVWHGQHHLAHLEIVLNK